MESVNHCCRACGDTAAERWPAESLHDRAPDDVRVVFSPFLLQPGEEYRLHNDRAHLVRITCVSACPSRLFVPTSLEFGFLGMMQPRMDFHAGHCNHECTICMNVCPSGAMLPLTVEQKKLTQFGVAKFIREPRGLCGQHGLRRVFRALSDESGGHVPYPNPVNKRLKISEVKPE